MSDGGMCPVDAFNGFRSILSGPAGGVVGYARTTFDGTAPVIGIDMVR
jgi:5-oxoprolinase (ATP-hydrolysing)